MSRLFKKGQEQVSQVRLPPRPLVAPAPPPVSSGKMSCADCNSTTRKLALARGTVQTLVCATCARERRNKKRLAGQQRRVERVYGITLEEKNELVEFQGGGCICKDWTGYNGNSRALSVDHDHATGVVRGALCKHCNDLLGRIRDDPAYFRRMIAYLENPPAVRLFGKRIAPEG